MKKTDVSDLIKLYFADSDNSVWYEVNQDIDKYFELMKKMDPLIVLLTKLL